MADGPDEVPQDPQTSRGGSVPRDSTRPAGGSGRPKPPTWVAMSGLGFEFVGAILLPGALGWWIDRKAGTTPWIMLVGGLLGFAIGLRLLMRSVSRPRNK